jgi:ribosomal protein S21|tara:strand:+ start:843 stop:1082 length:240 start_codon:yes stop_codon:yes gene_type:complete
MSNHIRNNNDNVRGMAVEVRNNDIARALRKLKKKLAEDGILQELRTREYFESKGTKRRLEKLAAIRRFKKQRIKDKDNW